MLALEHELSNTELDTPPSPSEPELEPAKPSFRTELSISVCSKIQTLHNITLWPLCKIGIELGIPVSTVYKICKQPSTPHHPCMGRPRLLTTPMRKRLVDYATASQENQSKSLAQIVEEAGITVNEQTLR